MIRILKNKRQRSMPIEDIPKEYGSRKEKLNKKKWRNKSFCFRIWSL